MSHASTYLLRRGLWAAGTLVAAVAATFVLVAATPDPNAAAAEFAAAQAGADPQQAASAYAAARNLEAPVVDRFLAFLAGVGRLDLGRSVTAGGAPVGAVLRDRLVVSLAYLLPAVALSVTAAVGLGAAMAVRNGSRSGRLVGAGAYLGLGLPNFWLAAVAAAVLAGPLRVDGRFDPGAGLLAPSNVALLATAGLVVSTTLIGGYLRYVRAEMGGYAEAEFVRLARAKGAGPARVARHVLSNVVPTLVSLFVTELLATLFVAAVVVETVLNVPGVGAALLAAIAARDLPLVMGVTLVVVVAGVGARFLQDVLRVVTDPRL